MVTGCVFVNSRNQPPVTDALGEGKRQLVRRTLNSALCVDRREGTVIYQKSQGLNDIPIGAHDFSAIIDALRTKANTGEG